MAARATIGVIGAGLMGAGIAQVFAAAGHSVRAFDVDAGVRLRLPEVIAGNLDMLGHSHDCLRLVSATDDLGEAVAQADFVIEAVSENLALKRRLFLEIAERAPADAVLASNTSVIPITDIARGNPAASRIIGTHWWNPPYLVPLVEVIRTEMSEDAALERASAWLREAGKMPVLVQKDVPGFIGNRLQHALWREAISLVEHGICDAETVDLVVKNSFGARLPVLGPLENADLVGLDLTIAIHETILPHLDRSERPSPLLAARVREGALGFRSGRGLRGWTDTQMAALRRRLSAHLLATFSEAGKEGGEEGGASHA